MRFEYDAASQRVSVTDALGNISTTVFDAVGRTSATVNANGFTTSQVFDGIGSSSRLSTLGEIAVVLAMTPSAGDRQPGRAREPGHVAI